MGKGRRALAVLGAALALGAAAGVFFALRPPCLIWEATGFYCGACGTTRMVEELLQGRVGAAFRQNPYMFWALPLGGLWLIGEAACFVRGRRPLWRRKWMRAALAAAVAAGGGVHRAAEPARIWLFRAPVKKP